MYSIIDETPEFLVINKHAGTSMHCDNTVVGVIERIRTDRNDRAIYPVHRLDKATSGLLLCAKSQAANALLSQQFQQRQVEKYYLAISAKKPKKKQGLIQGDMQKARRGSWKLLPSTHNPATTQFFSYAIEQGKRLFLLKPHTGKTHQLRVALKSIGAPIWGDRRYGVADQPQGPMALHAYVLLFNLHGTSYRYQCLPTGGAFDTTAKAVITARCDKPESLPWPKRL